MQKKQEQKVPEGDRSHIKQVSPKDTDKEAIKDWTEWEKGRPNRGTR